MRKMNLESRPGMRNRRGAMLAFAAVSMVGLMGMLAITLDVGAGNRQRRVAQTAADAGAIGGGTQIYRGMDDAAIEAAALNSAMRNGFAAGDISVFHPPATGPHAGDIDYVEVLVTKNIPTIFGTIFNMDSLDVQARGVAGLGSLSTYCIYSLATTGAGIDIPGDLTTNCGVVSNSSGDPAIYVKKGIEAPLVAAVGTVDGGPSGSTFTGIAPVPDPFASLQIPAETTCDYTNLAVNSDSTLNPGEYCGGITIEKNIRATLNPGTYVLRGGGLTGGEIVGYGVTIINANGPGNDVSAFRPITFGNSCLHLLTAPTSGPYKGIVIFVDPAGPSSGPNSINTFCGMGGDPDILGIIYMPNQTFDLGNSNGKLTVTGLIIAKNITGQNGGGKFWVNLDTSGNSAPKRLSLVE